MFTEAERAMTAGVAVRARPSRERSIDERYNMASIVQFVATGRKPDGSLFTKVAIQFPDDLLFESVNVLERIRALAVTARATATKTGASAVPALNVFALADNTFGSCCPDEVTAKHYGADAIVHLGYACFSQSSTLPVFNDTPQWTADLARVKDATEGAFAAGASTVVLLFHPGFTDVVARVAGEVAGAVLGDGAQPSLALAPSGSYFAAHSADGTRRLVLSEAIAAPPSDETRAKQYSQANPDEWTINGATFPRGPSQRFVFVGPEDAPQLHQLVMVAMHNEAAASSSTAEGSDDEAPATCNGAPAIAAEESITVVPTTRSNLETLTDGVDGGLPASLRIVRQRIRQRMFNIERLKEATAVGVVVASVGIRRFRETAEHLRSLLIRAGKRAYLIYIGHLNQYKLANFVDSVDCFVVVACPNSRIAHFTAKADNIMKPLISPSEVVVALGLADFMDPAGYTTQFDRILAVKDDAGRRAAAEDGGEDGPTVGGSLVTARPLNVAVSGSSALQRLSERNYVGLEPKVGQTAVQAALVQGKEGIAKGYATEAAAQAEASPAGDRSES